MKSLSWIFVLAGLWLIVAPFILEYSGSAQWNDIILGLVVGVLGLVSLSANDTSVVE